MQEKKFLCSASPSAHSKNSSKSVHPRFSFSWFNRRCWSSLLWARKDVWEGWQNQKTGAYLMTHSTLLRDTVLAIIIKFIPFKAETELPGKQCVSKDPPLVLHLAQPELYIQQIIFSAKQRTTTYITKWHNNLCEASQNCALGYILLHFSPAKARHNPEVMKMPVNKYWQEGPSPQEVFSSVMASNRSGSAEPQLSAKEQLFSGFIKEKSNRDSYSFLFFG